MKKKLLKVSEVKSEVMLCKAQPFKNLQ